MNTNTNDIYNDQERITSDGRYKTAKTLEAEELAAERQLAIAKATIQRNRQMRLRLEKELRDELSIPVVLSSVPEPETKPSSLPKIFALTFVGAVSCVAIAGIWLAYDARQGKEDIETVKKTAENAVRVASDAIIAPAKAEEPQTPPETRLSSAEAESVYAEYMSKRNPLLVSCGARMVSHKRWAEAVAISGAETSFCTKGVGRSKNNCGAIRSRIAGRTWRIYTTPCDGLEDIAYLIERKDYSDLTIDGMDGRYCVGEGGGECAGWSETAMGFLGELRANM